MNRALPPPPPRKWTGHEWGCVLEADPCLRMVVRGMPLRWVFLHLFTAMKPRLNSSDLFRKHLPALLSACGFIGVFIVSIPIIYMLALPPHTELMLFTALFALCHLANWPMLQVRWQLWFRGRLTPYAALCTTALLAGSFGIPFILLINLLQ